MNTVENTAPQPVKVKIPMTDYNWNNFFGEFEPDPKVDLVSEDGEHFVVQYASKENYETDLDRLCGLIPMEVIE